MTGRLQSRSRGTSLYGRELARRPGNESVQKSRELARQVIGLIAPQVVDQYISERALAYEAKRIGLSVSDEELANTIRGLLTRFTGGAAVDKAVYERIVNDQGFTIPQFEANMRKQILMTRIQNIGLEGVVVTPKEIEDEYKRRNTKAKIDYIVFKAGRGVVNMFTTNVGSPFDPKLEKDLAMKMASRA